MEERSIEGNGSSLKAPGGLFAERYRIIRRLANGGMSKLYLAEEVPLGRLVAIKIMLPVSLEDQRGAEEFRYRFFLEASTSTSLNHPNIVTVYNYGETSTGELYLATEYLEGRTLTSILTDEKRLSLVRSCLILSQVCSALRVAHRAHFMHSDLRPSNIMLINAPGEVDFVKVIDFGLVKNFAMDGYDPTEPTYPDGWVGSPLFKAPEQFANKEDSPQVDIYALGVILHRCVFGVMPFSKDSQLEIMRGHARPVVWPREASNYPEVCAIVSRCLHKHPSSRYSSIDALLGELQDLATGLPGGQSLLEGSNGFDAGGSNGFDETYESASNDANFLSKQIDIRQRSGEWISSDVEGLRNSEVKSGRWQSDVAENASVTKNVMPDQVDTALKAAERFSSSGLRIVSNVSYVHKNGSSFLETTSSISFIEVPSYRALLAWWMAVLLLGCFLGFLLVNLAKGWL